MGHYYSRLRSGPPGEFRAAGAEAKRPSPSPCRMGRAASGGAPAKRKAGDAHHARSKGNARSKGQAKRLRKQERAAKNQKRAAKRKARASDSDDSDDGVGADGTAADGTATQGQDAKKKKKKKKRARLEAGEPSQLRRMPPRAWAAHELRPFSRVMWDTSAPAPADARGAVGAARLREALGVRVPAVGSKVCAFWREGRCARGDACAFRHAEADAASPADAPAPTASLAHPWLPRLIGRAMLHLGHASPTPAQAQAWPVALAGHDLLCRAPTGTGKTLAYLLPAAVRVSGAAGEASASAPPAGAGPSVLVVVPTRELAVQVARVGCHRAQPPKIARPDNEPLHSIGRSRACARPCARSRDSATWQSTAAHRARSRSARSKLRSGYSSRRRAGCATCFNLARRD